MSSISTLVEAMVRYLQSGGISTQELAQQTGIPRERLAVSEPELSPSQMTRLWLRVQESIRPSPEFSLRVRELIDVQLECGKARAAVIAGQLHMSRQTLYKKLKDENQTFAALLDQVRREHALVYLQDPDESLTTVSQRLGFSELSAFSRAFKRWMGESPAQYRSRLSSEPR